MCSLHFSLTCPTNYETLSFLERLIQGTYEILYLHKPDSTDSAHNRPVPGHVPMLKPLALAYKCLTCCYLHVPFKDTGIKMWPLNWLIYVTIGRFQFSESLRLLFKAFTRARLQIFHLFQRKHSSGKHGSQHE